MFSDERSELKQPGFDGLDRNGHEEEHLILEFRDGVRVYVPASKIDLVQKYVGGGKTEPELSKLGGTGWQSRKDKVQAAVLDIVEVSGTTRHPVETYAIRALANAQTVVYTADTGPSRPVTDFAWGANLLIAEASFQQSSKETADLHMSAQEAGQMAAQAQVTQLALTHLVPGLDPNVSIEQARREYRGEIHVACDNLRLLVY